MTITITDPGLVAQILAANGVVHLRDAEGHFLAEFDAATIYRPTNPGTRLDPDPYAGALGKGDDGDEGNA